MRAAQTPRVAQSTSSATFSQFLIVNPVRPVFEVCPVLNWAPLVSRMYCPSVILKNEVWVIGSGTKTLPPDATVTVPQHSLNPSA